MEKSFYSVWHNKYLRQYIYSKIRGCSSILAAKYNNIEAFKYSILQKDYVPGGLMTITCQCGHFDLVRWLYECRKEHTDEWAMNWACATGHLDIAQYLHNMGEKCTDWALYMATVNNNLTVVKWLYENYNFNTASLISARNVAKEPILSYLINF